MSSGAEPSASWSSSATPTPESPAAVRLCQTGLYIAACRAIESAKPESERLFFDPFAAEFASSYGPAMLKSLAGEFGIPSTVLANHVAVRTKFLDERIIEAANAGIQQFLIAGVGGDFRSSRLPLPEGSTVYEVDLPEALQYRQDAINQFRSTGASSTVKQQSKAKVISVPANVTDPNWVAAVESAGFDRSQPSFILAEGLLMYLSDSDAKLFLSQMKAICCPGSRIAGDLLNSANFSHPTGLALMAVWGRWAAAPITGWDQPESIFESNGFQCMIREFGQDETCDFGYVSPINKKYYFTDNPRPGSGSGAAASATGDVPRNFLFAAQRV